MKELEIPKSVNLNSPCAMLYALCAQHSFWLGFKDTKLLHSVSEGIAADV